MQNQLTEQQLKILKTINKMAVKEGWGMFYKGFGNENNSECRIQRIDEGNSFYNDETAIVFVVELAIKYPTSLYSWAIKLIRQISPHELYNIITPLVGANKIKLILNN